MALNLRPTFEKGDRVRVTSAASLNYEPQPGMAGTVLAVTGDSAYLYVRWDDANYQGLVISDGGWCVSRFAKIDDEAVAKFIVVCGSDITGSHDTYEAAAKDARAASDELGEDFSVYKAVYFIGRKVYEKTF
jgi:hypothetical protein